MSIIKPLERSELRHKLSIVVDMHLKTLPVKEFTDRPF